MAQCVEFKTVAASDIGATLDQPVLVLSDQDFASCTSYLLVTPAEYSAMQLGDLWMFDPVQSGKFFGFSFTLILSVYLVAWGYGQLLNFLDSRR